MKRSRIAALSDRFAGRDAAEVRDLLVAQGRTVVVTTPGRTVAVPFIRSCIEIVLGDDGRVAELRGR